MKRLAIAAVAVLLSAGSVVWSMWVGTSIWVGYLSGMTSLLVIRAASLEIQTYLETRAAARAESTEAASAPTVEPDPVPDPDEPRRVGVALVRCEVADCGSVISVPIMAHAVTHVHIEPDQADLYAHHWTHQRTTR